MIPVEERDDIWPIGSVASQLGISLRKVERLATTLGMTAAARISGVVYLDGHQIEKLRSVLPVK